MLRRDPLAGSAGRHRCMSRPGVTADALVLLTDISRVWRSLGSRCCSSAALGSASTCAQTLSIALRESVSVILIVS